MPIKKDLWIWQEKGALNATVTATLYFQFGRTFEAGAAGSGPIRNVILKEIMFICTSDDLHFLGARYVDRDGLPHNFMGDGATDLGHINDVFNGAPTRFVMETIFEDVDYLEIVVQNTHASNGLDYSIGVRYEPIK